MKPYFQRHRHNKISDLAQEVSDIAQEVADIAQEVADIAQEMQISKSLRQNKIAKPANQHFRLYIQSALLCVVLNSTKDRTSKR